jgi:hypothetical protein
VDRRNMLQKSAKLRIKSHFATSSQWAFRFQVEDAFGLSHVTNTCTTSDLVDTVRSVAIEAHISSGPSGGLCIYG